MYIDSLHFRDMDGHHELKPFVRHHAADTDQLREASEAEYRCLGGVARWTEIAGDDSGSASAARELSLHPGRGGLPGLEGRITGVSERRPTAELSVFLCLPLSH